jgi:flagellar basal body-associated protein FliL
MATDEVLLKEVIDADIKKLWKLAQAFGVNNSKVQNAIEQARGGFSVKYDIRYYLNDLVNDLSYKGRFVIKSLGLEVPNEKFWDDLEMREAILRDVCIEIARGESKVKSRLEEFNDR